ncbi:MAG: hypothetical protein ACKVOR_11745 [Flavobacteriales bacterium]
MELREKLHEDLRVLEKEASTFAEFHSIIKDNENLNRLYRIQLDYCIDLDKPYQTLPILSALHSTSQPTEPRNLDWKWKDRLFVELTERIIPYLLSCAYKECESNISILAYSHRRIGWNSPKILLQRHFGFEIKSNFGFGTSSYFFTKIFYKEYPITPYSEWIDYRFAKISEIIRYSKRHELLDESWGEAMQYIAEAYNLLIENENLFVEKYILVECEKMIQGLEDLLKHQKMGLVKEVIIEPRTMSFEFGISEMKGEKISGALDFIQRISEFTTIVTSNNFVDRIIQCNRKVLPELVQELDRINIEIDKIEIERIGFYSEFEKVNNESKVYNSYRSVLCKSIATSKNCNVREIDTEELDEQFNILYPEYKTFRSNAMVVWKKFYGLTSRKRLCESTFLNISNHINKINSFFNSP